MPSLSKPLAALALAGVLLSAGTASANPKPLPNGMATDTRKASELPGLQGFLNLPASQRSQFDIFYALKIKHASLAGSSITLNDHGRQIPMHMAPDGRISPLPTREQVNSGATITVVYPQAASEALKLRVFSTQPLARDYDPSALALGIRQANSAMAKIGGVLVIAVPRLDRVYFVGSDSGTVDIGGDSQPLPIFEGDNDIPGGTPYFVPSKMSGATQIHLSNPPSITRFDTPPK